MAIIGFRDERLAALFAGMKPRKRFSADLIAVTQRKLNMLHAAETLDDLRSPPANRLEALRGDQAGQHSIRVNDQFRLCFVWTGQGASEVEFTDYH